MKNNTITQSGRSMIEMLGVLAIVGVLSVGGIAGYSKAMQKYRTNKTIEQVTQIINGIRTLFSNQKNYSGIDETVLRKAKILPESAWEGTGQYATPKNPFGGEFYIYPHSKYRSAGTWGGAFEVGAFGIPDDACIELATQDWGDATGFVGITVSGGSIFVDNCTSGAGSGWAVQCAKDGPMPIDYAIQACISGNNNIYWIQY